MEIKRKSTESDRTSRGAYTLEHHEVDRLIGQLLTLIDALGLKDRQEKSLKDLIKQNVWHIMDQNFYLNGQVLVLAEDIHWQIKDETQQLNAKETTKKDRERGIHPGPIVGDYELKFTSKKAK